MYSFGIITDGKEPEKLGKQIKSITDLGIMEYEIMVAGADTPYTTIAMSACARQGRLGAMRNRVCMNMAGDVLVVTDDDMLFHPDWYEGMQKYGDGLDLLSCRILNPDGTRYWDWKAHENGMNWLLDYDTTHPSVSLTGGLTIMKRYVYDQVKWSNELGFNQAEDVDFTRRIKQAGFRIAFNPHATITHDAPYTQKGVGVFKINKET